MLYEFEVEYNTTEAIKKKPSLWAKWRWVDYSTITRLVKKFCLGCKNLDDHTMSGRSKIMDSEVMLQAVELLNYASHYQNLTKVLIYLRIISEGIRFGLVSSFNSISTFMSYSLPKPSL